MAGVDERAVAKMASDARDAVAQGDALFVPRLAKPDSSWGRQIAAIEAEGWHLEHWTLSLNSWFNTVAHPVFRRAGG